MGQRRLFRKGQREERNNSRVSSPLSKMQEHNCHILNEAKSMMQDLHICALSKRVPAQRAAVGLDENSGRIVDEPCSSD